MGIPYLFEASTKKLYTVTTKMKSVCLILLAIALYCDAAATRNKREEVCTCDGTKIETEDGLIVGECLSADKNGFFCYVSNKECASPGTLGLTQRFKDKWVSYELCDCKGNGDCETNK